MNKEPAKEIGSTSSRIARIRVVVLATADFDAPVWTNKQHIAMELARDFDVTYVESLGLRRPTLSRADLGRFKSRITSVVFRPRRMNRLPRSSRKGCKDIQVVSPRVIPFHHNGLIRSINRRSLQRQVGRLLKGGQPGLLWTFSPITYDLSRLFD